MKEKKEKVITRQKTILIAVIFLLCLSGVGVFFLLNYKDKAPAADDEATYTGKWDVSWYDKNEKEYVITTKEQLFGLADLSQENSFKGKTIKLGADIVINEGNAMDWKDDEPDLNWTPIGRDKMPFNGTFDGQGHSISGIYLNVSDEMAGFFAATDDASQILNFKILNSYYKMAGDQGVGSVACRAAGLYSQIYSDAIVDCEGTHAGGLIGYKKNKGVAIISECWFDGSVNTTQRFAGGLVGRVFQGGCTIQHCLNTGDIYSTFPGPEAATIGGIVGSVTQLLTITDCFNSGLLANEVGRPEVASIIGSVSQAGNVTAGLNWSTKEGAASSVGKIHSDATVAGTFFQLPEKLLTGFEAYKRTDLDFEKYWAVVEDGTPMLQYFAETIPSVAGYERAMLADTSWYDITKMEYVLTTPEQLKGLAVLSIGGQSFYGKTIKLGNDITYNTGKAEKYNKDIPLNMWIPINKFMGNFDGQGHSISGLYVSGATDNVGMFALTEKQAVIKNFKLVNSYFENTTTNSEYGTASVVGMGGGTLERIYSDAIVITSARHGGGIIGRFCRDGSISECWFDGEVMTAGRRSGGIAAACTPYYVSGNPMKTTTKISHCLNTGYIHRTGKVAKDSATSGGIVGIVYNYNTTIIEDCFSAGKVTSPKYENGDYDELGAICSCVADGGTATIKNSWGTIQSFKKTIWTIKKTAKTNITMSSVLDETIINGYNAVCLTTLNFNKYWAVDLDGTPILKYFAKNAPSTAGVILPKTSWYTDKKSEFVINTVEELYGFSLLANTGVDFEGKIVKLGKDITVNTGNAADWTVAAPTNSWFPIKSFKGTFDGQGHTISGLYSVDGEKEELGRALFTKTEKTTVIQNVRLVNSYFETKTAYGLSAISSRGCGTFKNIYTDAILNNKGGDHTGGILGYQLWDDAVIENCWFDGEITSIGRRIGGILGRANKFKTTISHCLYTGSITRDCAADTTTAALAGGFVGTATGTMTISDSLSIGTLSSKRTITDIMGSLVGETVKNNNITLSNLYASSTSWSKIIGSNASKANTTTCLAMSDKYLKGENASLYTMLDFHSHWAVIKNGTPELKIFATGNIVSNPKIADTSWYNGITNMIDSVEDFYGFLLLSNSKNFKGETIHLSADIEVNGAKKDGTDAKSYKTTPPSILWTAVEKFAGEFNGHGYAISGLYGNADEEYPDGIALFARPTKDAYIHDFSLMNSYFESSVAGLAGIVSKGQGKLENIRTNVILYNEVVGNMYMGGIVGMPVGPIEINNCWSEAEIKGAGRFAGGILGSANNQQVTIQHCLNTGNLHRFGEQVDKNRACYGGIIGSTVTKGKEVFIHDCLSIGNVTSDRTDADSIGAIAGEGPGKDYKGFVTIQNCYGQEGSCKHGLVDANKNNIITSDNGMVSRDNLLGVKAFENTTLDFKNAENHWVVRGDGITAYTDQLPTLKVFDLNWKDYLYGVIKADTSWYNANKSSGTITDKWDLYGLAKLVNEGTMKSNYTVYVGNDIQVNSLAEGAKASAWKETRAEYNWTPIGNASKYFEGTFDGKGHTISGIYLNAEAEAGLFGCTNLATIQNMKLSNSYLSTSGASSLGGIVGKGTGTFANIYCDDSVIIATETSTWVGGIIGTIERKGSSYMTNCTIENCWFDGTIEQTVDTTGNVYTGGLVGYQIRGNGTNGNLIIDNCLYNGKMDITVTLDDGKRLRAGGIVGGKNAGGTSATNAKFTISNCLSDGEIFVEQTDDSSGSISVGTVFGYSSSPTGDNYDNVYAVANINYNAVGYSNDIPANVIVKSATELYGTAANLDYTTYWKSFENDTPKLKYFFGEVPENYKWYVVSSGDATDPYILSTADELDVVATMTKEGNSFKGKTFKLANDITYNQGTENLKTEAAWEGARDSLKEWTPIGNASNYFEGTFDGNGHTISGVYLNAEAEAGLFGCTNLATIQNVKLSNSYLSTSGASSLGGIVGKGTGTFVNIYCDDSVIIATETSTWVGGIIGTIERKNSSYMTNCTIENCWFAGTIKQTVDTTGNVYTGGLVGYQIRGNGNNGNLIIDNCLYTGEINSTATLDGTKHLRVGGIVGGKNAGGTGATNAKFSMSNCLSAGKMNVSLTTASEGQISSGAVFGYATNTETGESYSNVYATTECYNDAVGNQANTPSGVTFKSAAELYGTAANLDYTSLWQAFENDTPKLKYYLGK